jgi:hypothetical protein
MMSDLLSHHLGDFISHSLGHVHYRGLEDPQAHMLRRGVWSVCWMYVAPSDVHVPLVIDVLEPCRWFRMMFLQLLRTPLPHVYVDVELGLHDVHRMMMSLLFLLGLVTLR